MKMIKQINNEINIKTDKILYRIGWCLLAMYALCVIVMKNLHLQMSDLLPPCLLHVVTGFYCPGCGGTRALSALMHGQPLKSFFYHPAVLYVAGVGGWFMISQTIARILRKYRTIGMHYKERYLWLLLIVVVVNCIVKNLVLAIWHIDLCALI